MSGFSNNRGDRYVSNPLDDKTPKSQSLAMILINGCITSNGRGEIKCLASFVKNLESIDGKKNAFSITNEISCNYDKCEEKSCDCHDACDTKECHCHENIELPNWITKVQISNCSIDEKLHLHSVPSIILRMTTLTDLDLSYNNIKKLPDEIGLLSNLIHLDFTRNPLEYISSNLKQLTCLTTLQMTVKVNNSVRPEIPDELFALELYKLCCCNCTHDGKGRKGLFIDDFDTEENNYCISEKRNAYYDKRINKTFNAIVVGNNKLCENFCSFCANNDFTQFKVKPVCEAKDCNSSEKLDNMELNMKLYLSNLGSRVYKNCFKEFFKVSLILIITFITLMIILILDNFIIFYYC